MHFNAQFYILKNICISERLFLNQIVLEWDVKKNNINFLFSLVPKFLQ